MNKLVPLGSTYNPCTMNRNEKLARNILCVMATNPADERFSEVYNNQPVGSNFGSPIADIGAPGREILSTVPPATSDSEVLHQVLRHVM